MQTILHKATTRGHASFGWLNSYHSFSFGNYYHPERIHFGALRVLNDDTVSAGMGFGEHPHDNMEIVSIPLSGDLHHRDSTGRNEIIRQGDVQIMSAGSGISHSEMNANKDREVKFLQLWIMTGKRNIPPRYEQKSFAAAERKNTIVPVVAPDIASAVWINQNAWLSMADFSEGFTAEYPLRKQENGVYVFLLNGNISVNGQEMNSRDGLGIWETTALQIKANQASEILLIEVPMPIQKV